MKETEGAAYEEKEDTVTLAADLESYIDTYKCDGFSRRSDHSYAGNVRE